MRHGQECERDGVSVVEPQSYCGPELPLGGIKFTDRDAWICLRHRAAYGWEKAEIELIPDAWARFERAVGVVAKSPPQHRTKPKRARNRKKAKPRRKAGASPPFLARKDLTATGRLGLCPGIR